MGRFEFLLGAEESADPAAPELDDGTFELIRKLLFSIVYFFSYQTRDKAKDLRKREENPIKSEIETMMKACVII